MLFVISVSSVFSQNKNYEIDGRFIIIENQSKFFVEKESSVEIEKFYVHNFADNESSKQEQVAVDELANVLHFAIASGAEQFNNQRRCHLTIEKENYLKTFYSVLLELNVKTVVFNGEELTVGEFYKQILKK